MVIGAGDHLDRAQVANTPITWPAGLVGHPCHADGPSPTLGPSGEWQSENPTKGNLGAQLRVAQRLCKSSENPKFLQGADPRHGDGLVSSITTCTRSSEKDALDKAKSLIDGGGIDVSA